MKIVKLQNLEISPKLLKGGLESAIRGRICIIYGQGMRKGLGQGLWEAWDRNHLMQISRIPMSVALWPEETTLEVLGHIYKRFLISTEHLEKSHTHVQWNMVVAVLSSGVTFDQMNLRILLCWVKIWLVPNISQFCSKPSKVCWKRRMKNHFSWVHNEWLYEQKVTFWTAITASSELGMKSKRQSAWWPKYGSWTKYFRGVLPFLYIFHS